MNKLKLRIPATTANIGSGFDCAGIALTLYNTFYFSEDTAARLEIIQAERDYANEDNLVYRTMKQIAHKYEVSMPEHLRIQIDCDIPIARGLGSSSTCILAGILAADYYLRLNLDDEQKLALACQLEGHPDNVAPAYLGKMVLALMADDHVYHESTTPHSDLRFIAIIEAHEVLTKQARAVLPDCYSRADAQFNLARTPFLLSAFTEGSADLLRAVTQDRIHQAYRATLIQDYTNYQNELNQPPFITHWISGSGSTVIALVNKNDTKKALEILSAHVASTTELKVLLSDEQGIVSDQVMVD